MRVTAPDIELWLTGYVRSVALVEGITAKVSNKEPSSLSLPLAKPLIVIRDDSGPRLDWTTFDRSIGFSVLAGTKADDKPANDIARWVAAILFDDALPMIAGSPITSVNFGGCNGPYAVPEALEVARRYGTAQYTVTGTW